MNTSRDVDAQEAAAMLQAAESVTVLCHMNPDADAVGSALALGIALQRAGTSVQVSFASPAALTESLASLPGGELLVAAKQVAREVDLLVAVDCGSLGRLGALRDRTEGAQQTLVIDHHASNTHFGTANLVDCSAESTTVLVCDVLDEWGVQVDATIAHCLYAGLVTDTSSFRRARPETHELAARFIAAGIDPVAVSRPLMYTHPFGWLGMLSAVLGRAVLDRSAAGGRGLAYVVVRSGDAEGLRPEETESVVDLVATISEAEVAAVFKQIDDTVWSISMRAKSDVDVSVVASALGGGGHRLAAGYTAHGTAEEVVAALRTTLG
ncbi:MAG: DHH family phosphoesterase [Mycobacteriaceae bacterium]